MPPLVVIVPIEVPKAGITNLQIRDIIVKTSGQQKLKGSVQARSLTNLTNYHSCNQNSF